MADVTQTAANVIAGVDAVIDDGYCGETLVQGNVVYQDATTKQWKKGDANGAAALQVAKGIALTGGAVNQPCRIARSGTINVGGTLVPGTTYCLSATAGGICPQADLVTGCAVAILGVAKSASLLVLNIQNPGVVL